MIKDELATFKKEGVAVHILDLPQTMLPAANKAQRQIFEMVTNILIEVMGYVAEEEREAIRSRQAEGIAAWRRNGNTETDNNTGDLREGWWCATDFRLLYHPIMKLHPAPGKWNTVCLPFTIDDVEAFFGAGAKAYTFNSYVNG